MSEETASIRAERRTALHILLSAGIGAALLRFRRLELEAHRSG